MALSDFATFGLRVLASSLVNAATNFFSGEKLHGQNWDIARFNAAQQEKLEDKRQKMQTTQIMMQYLQHQDNQVFQASQARLNREHQAELERFRQQVQQEINERNLQFQGWKLGKEQELQRELANYNRETQQLMATFQRETTLRLPEVNKLYETWPLRIVPLQILNDQPNGGNPPLKVIIAPPDVYSDKFGASVANVPKLEKGLAEGLRHFFGKHYPLEHAQRPVEFLGGAWDAKRFHGESSIKALFSMLNSEALLVLESEIDGDYLNMRFAYWAAGQARYTYAPVLTRFPYLESVYESAKARAQKWEKPHDLLLQQGKNPKLLNEVDTYNLAVLRENEQLAEFGVDISQLPPRYKLRTEDFEALNQFLVLNHRLVAGLMTDVHYLLQHDVPPVLPQWLQAFIAQGVGAELLQPVVDAFRQVLHGLASERPAWAADLGVDLATSLAALPDKTWARAVLADSLRYWLNARGELGIIPSVKARLVAVNASLTLRDTDYVQKLQICLNLLGGRAYSLDLQESLDKQRQLKAELEQSLRFELEQRERVAAAAKVRAEVAASIKAERKVLEAKFNPVWASHTGQDQYGRYADLNVKGVTQRFRWIEAGTFLMGSPRSEPERYDNEVQHQVTLTKGYWLADTACTQALWQVVMGNNPAHFKDNTNNPVEQVSWDDVQGFLQALNQRVSGLTARLPTEAEWEYACRAGTTTPFAFGNSISPSQANYNGNYPYAGGQKGEYRQKTVPVKSFEPNAWGLYQMHGNVWEWCQDWCQNSVYPMQAVTNPQGAASGSYRVLRGGSWVSSAQGLRSASRRFSTPDNRNNLIGFRLVLGQA
ncbi:MAG: hypothetical protein RI964_2479 [Pseudomonadota bacterium]|jgi:formylglycine-generating enzyme required for sulfatase activity